jgi:hypothetical protein
MVNRMRYMDNKWARDIELWFEHVKEGYIVEFSMECGESFNNAEIKFAAGPRRRLLEEIPLWINMLFMKKGLMCMDPNRMVE